jgi:hypothetical protein
VKRDSGDRAAAGYNHGVGKLAAVALLAALSAGAVTVYNAAVHEVLEPLPVTWTRTAEELEILELERARRGLADRLGSTRRVVGLSGFAAVGPQDPGADLAAELAALDRRIAALRAELARRGSR